MKKLAIDFEDNDQKRRTAYFQQIDKNSEIWLQDVTGNAFTVPFESLPKNSLIKLGTAHFQENPDKSHTLI